MPPAKPKRSPLCPQNSRLASEVSALVGPDFTPARLFLKGDSVICKDLFWVFLYALGFSFKDHSIPTHPLGPVILVC